METKFTKGEWKTDLIIYDFDKHHKTIEVSNSAIWVCQINSNEIINKTEAMSNALLISKAPEMFEMLESVLELQKENYGSGTNTHLALISKAKEIEQLLKEATEL